MYQPQQTLYQPQPTTTNFVSTTNVLSISFNASNSTSFSTSKSTSFNTSESVDIGINLNNPMDEEDNEEKYEVHEVGQMARTKRRKRHHHPIAGNGEPLVNEFTCQQASFCLMKKSDHAAFFFETKRFVGKLNDDVSMAMGRVWGASLGARCSPNPALIPVEDLIGASFLTQYNAPNMFSIRIHQSGKFQRYPGRMYVSGRVDIFDMVDIDLFTVVALNMMVLKLGYTGKSEPMFYNYLRPLTSLDEGLYALACEEDVRYLATLVRSFKLIEVYIEHGVTALDSYLRALRFRATLEEITDEPGSIAAKRTKKMLLLTWHESSETTKEPICNFITPISLPQHDSSTPSPTSKVIDNVMRELSFDETKLDGDAGFADVAESGVDSSGLSHDESFGVDDLDLDLNLNEPINLNVS
ncbi:hypothetical protein Tco_0295922 [Tanacetum coccineum]